MTIIWAIVLLGVLVFVHEFGHFITAKLSRVKVLKFSLGFGPRIAGFRKGGTEYMISAIPLGGYVKLLGEDPDEELPAEEMAYSFGGQPVWKRALIAFAGPFFNLLLTYVIFAYFLSVGFPVNIPKLADMTPVVGSTLPGSPGQKAGLKPGDTILEVDGKPIATWFDVVGIISAKPNQPVSMKIKRDSGVFKIAVTPEAVKEMGPDGKEVTIGRIGIQRMGDAMPFHVVEAKNPFQAVYKAAEGTGRMAYFIWDTIVKLVSGSFSLNTLGGPIAIVQESGKAAAMGVFSYLMFMAIISANLAVLNLLPIPILDGGHLMFLAIEGVRKKPLSESTQMILQRAGLMILIFIMVFALHNDIVRLIRGQ